MSEMTKGRKRPDDAIARAIKRAAYQALAGDQPSKTSFGGEWP